MPAANFPEYVRDLQATLNEASALGEVEVTMLQVDQRSALRGLVAGSLQFGDGSTFIDVYLPAPLPEEDVLRLEQALRERCNEILVETGLFIIGAVQD